MKEGLVHSEETYKIIGAAMAVHRYFGCGFTEKIYQDALEIEMQSQGIPYQREVPIQACYRGRQLQTQFIPGFVCYNHIVVELKAVKELEDYHRSQAFNYAKVAGLNIALLINFGETSLYHERFIVPASKQQVINS